MGNKPINQKAQSDLRQNMEDFKIGKEKLKTKIIDELLNYVRNGGTFHYNSSIFLENYSFIQDFGNKDDYAKELLNLHNETIEQATTESYEKIKDLSGDELIDAFITYTERLNFVVLMLSKIFSYLSFSYFQVIHHFILINFHFSMEIFVFLDLIK